MKTKNSFFILLMTSTLALLIVLQAFWLRSSYEKGYHDLRGKIDFLFRNSVYAVRDSSFLQKLIPGDSTQKNIYFSQSIDTLPVPWKKMREAEFRSSQIQIYISSTGKPDSIKALLQPLASRFHDGSLKGTRFTYRPSDDSLSMDSIKAVFKKNLTTIYPDLSFKIKKSKSPPFDIPGGGARRNRLIITNDRIGPRNPEGEEKLSVFANKIEMQSVRIPPFSRYSGEVENIRPMIIREIAPQIFFSGVLTLMTTLSFVFMFRSIRSQQRLMQLKNDFISNVTHELKTPIATVSVALEAIKNFKGIDNPKLTGEYLDIAQHELSRLTVLADKVLTTSLFDEHGVKIEFEKVNIEKTVIHALDSLKLIFDKREAKIEFHKTGDDFIIEGSNIHLTNVIHNLLDNALKYSPQHPQISVTLTDAGERIKLTIADKGLGIPSEFHKKIFEKFFRMPTGDVHNIKGYGLGLSYVESVVKSHQGTITVDSKPGDGSAFTLSLKKNRG